MSHILSRSFRNRLFAAMLTASLVPLLICSALLVQITRLRLDSKTQEDALQQSESLLQSLDMISESIDSAASLLSRDPVVSQGLTPDAGNNLQVNARLFSATDGARSFAAFDLYDMSGSCRYSTQSATFQTDLPTDWGLLYAAASHVGSSVYYAWEDPADAGSSLLLCASQLYNRAGSPIGYLVMRMGAQDFAHLLDGKYPQSDVLVLNRFFRPVYGSQTYLTATLAPALRQQLLAGRTPGADADEYVYTVAQHAPTGLFLVLQQPQMFSHSTMQLLYTASGLCALVCIAISILMSLQLSRQIFLPIGRLQTAISQVQHNDLETQIPVQSQDELGQLADRFNRMVSALKANRAELLRNQQELNDAQIRMLQAQLNPHFLCNTLDTMKWISKINKVPQVALMSTNLADILRSCISPEEFVPLYRELDILERYIEIQKIRLSDDFTFLIQVPEELESCLVPKMILQPIVENAILHGLNGVSGSIIRVDACRTEQNMLRISVTDNGKGFPEEMVGRPYHRDGDLAKGHLGLYNVDTILTRYYGDGCGLYLDRGSDGCGACVTATLPIRFEEDRVC